MLGIFGIASIAGVGASAAIGTFDWRIVSVGFALFPIVLLGNWVGSLAFGKVNDSVWRSLVGAVLGAAALAAFGKLFL